MASRSEHNPSQEKPFNNPAHQFDPEHWEFTDDAHRRAELAQRRNSLIGLVECFHRPGDTRYRELSDLISDEALQSTNFQRDLERSNLMLGALEQTKIRVQANEPDNETIDLDLMREALFRSLVGNLHEFKFWSDKQANSYRSELEMMRRLLDQAHPGRADWYVSNWIKGVYSLVEEFPYHLRREEPSELIRRVIEPTQTALPALYQDSVLDRVIRVAEIHADIALVIMERDDQQKEIGLNVLIDKLEQDPGRYLRRKPLEQLKRNPKLLISRILEEGKYIKGEILQKSLNDPKYRRALEASTVSNEGFLEALKDYCGTDPRESDQPISDRTLNRLGKYFNQKVIDLMRENRSFLAESVVLDIVKDRVRALNTARRRIMGLAQKAVRAAVLPQLFELRRETVAIANFEQRSRNRAQQRLGGQPIVPAEFTSELRPIISRVNEIEAQATGALDLSQYNNLLIRTTVCMVKLMEALRVRKDCLSYDFPWGESHYTIPELLLSGTTETIVLEGPDRSVESSLTVRLLPLEIDGKLEPVLFRQKARIKEGSGLHRVLLNDAVIHLAAYSGVTRIVMSSGFIGNPEALGYNPTLYDEGFTIEYTNGHDRTVKERVRLKNRRLVPSCRIKFVEPDVSTSDGFHAHDNKHEYPYETEEIEGIVAKTFTDPEDRPEAQVMEHKGFYVVDIEREY